jgi:uncharacterized protein (DUF1778 family)
MATEIHEAQEAVEQLTLNLPASKKRVIERAAAAAGRSAADFAETATFERACEFLDYNTHIVLSPADWDAFMELLDREEVEPTPAMVEALKRHKERHGEK